MAFDQETENPGKFGAATANWPFGVPRDVSAPAAGDGSPWNEKTYGDIYGFISSLFDAMSVTPNGAVDNVGNPQILDSLAKYLPYVASLQILKHVPDDAGDKIDGMAISPPDFFGRSVQVHQIRIDAEAFGDFNIRDDNGDLIAEVEAATVGASPDMQTVTIIKNDPVGKLYVQEIGLNASNYTKFGLFVTLRYNTN